MKRFASVCMAAMMLTSAVSYLPAVSTAVYAEISEEMTSGDFRYVIVDNDHIEICGCSEEAVELTIPAEIDGLPVTAIGSNAFNSNTNLTVVSIPEGVTEIGEYAFYSCENLVSISLPNGLKKIGQ